MSSEAVSAESRVAAVREFNRRYTRSAGLITDNLLGTPHTLTEARVLYELGPEAELSLGEVRERIGLDPGYLSRVVTRLEAGGMVSKRRSSRDGRRQILALTPEGARHRAMLDGRSAEQARGLLERVGEEGAGELVAAMRTISGILHAGPGEPEPIVLRAPEPGDLGWIVQRHGALYAREYGWGRAFEALVAAVVADFARAEDPPDRAAAWIAELGGERAGSVLCVPAGDRVAKLRLLLVEPAARGRGIGSALVGACVRFARAAGYEELTLWTNDVLTHARPIYEAAGFALTDSEPHRMFGPPAVGQKWRLRLDAPAAP